MARLKQNDFPPLLWSELNHPLIFVVDMINGFAKEGALADPAIAKTAAPIAALLKQADPERIWFVTDAHQPEAVEFKTFPVHCLKGSKESEVIDELQFWYSPQRRIEKNSISTAAVPGFFEWLENQENVCDLIITGCCTDLCVAQLALPLQYWISQNQKNCRVIVPADCVDTYDLEGIHPAVIHNELALNYMKAAGIEVAGTIKKDIV